VTSTSWSRSCTDEAVLKYWEIKRHKLPSCLRGHLAVDAGCHEHITLSDHAKFIHVFRISVHTPETSLRSKLRKVHPIVQGYANKLIVELRTALFLAITQRVVVVPYRRFGITYQYHLQGSNFCSWFLKMGPIDCPETSVRNYHYLLRSNPEEHSSLLILIIKPKRCTNLSNLFLE
jgi:hypothetical protein